MPRPLREYSITLALLAATLALAFFPILFQGKLLLPSDMIDTMTLPFSAHYTQPYAQNSYVSDGLLQFYPYKLLVRDAWLHGRFAFWNPLNLCGYPGYAETMATNFDVLNIVLLLLPMPLAFHIYLLLPLLLVGIGFYLFLRNYGVDIWIARIFSTSYMLCGLFITHLLPHFIPGSMCWAPFVALFLKRYFDTGHRYHLLLAGVALCLGFLGGNVQTASFLAFLVVMYGLSYSSKTSRIRFSDRILSLIGALTLGFLLSAIMWLPTLELFWNVLQNGVVASTSLVHGYSLLQRLLSIPMLLTFFLPQLAGSPNGLSIYSGSGAYTIDFNGAIGYILLLIGLWAVATRWRDREILPFALLASLGLVLPIATPLYRFLYHRFFIVAMFGFCGAGALGFQRVLQDTDVREAMRRWVIRTSYVFAAIGAVLLLTGLIVLTNYHTIWRFVLALAPRFQHLAFSEGNPRWVIDRLHATLDNYSLASAPLLLSLVSIVAGYYLLLKLLRAPKRKESGWLAGLWIVSAFQVALFAYTWLPHVNPDKFPLLPRTRLTDMLRTHPDGRVYVDRRLHPNEQYLFIDNENIAYGIPVVSGFESLLPRSFYLNLPRLATDSSEPAKLLGLLDAGYVLSGHSSHLSNRDFELADSGMGSNAFHGYRLWRNRWPVRRAWFSDTVVASSNDSATLAWLTDTTFDPRKVILARPDNGAMLSNARALPDTATLPEIDPVIVH